MESPLDEYSKAFVEMRGGIKVRNDKNSKILIVSLLAL